MITLENFWMGRDASHASELTPELIKSAKETVDKVNLFLQEIGVKEAKVTSGWRPAGINAAAGGAKKSNHMLCLAVDIADADCTLWNKVVGNLEAAKKYGLYFEDKRWSPTWVHIQTIAPKSKKRIFVPSSAPAPAPKIWSGEYDPKYDG